MCFNASASLGAFSIGALFLVAMVQRKMYSLSILYATIIVMQLAEYYAHNSLLSNNKYMNRNISLVILAILFLQPVIWSLYNAVFHIKKTSYKNIIYLTVALFSLFITYFYSVLKKSNALRIDYLKKSCSSSSSICRLDWSFFKESIPLSIVFLFFYFFLFVFSNFAVTTKKNMRLIYAFGALPILLALSIVFMIFVDKIHNMSTIISGFGSIWCISSVLIGPIALLHG